MSGHQQSREPSRVGGGVAGVGAFVLGYLGVFLVKSSDISNYLASSGGVSFGSVGAPPDWKFGGWLFYAAHNVEMSVSATALGQTQSQTVSLQSNAAVWDGYLLAIPAVALVLAGAWVASNANARDQSEGIRAGVSIAPGYFLATVAGIFLFSWSRTVESGFVSGSFTAQPELVNGALIAGLAYPLVLGAIGGVLGASSN